MKDTTAAVIGPPRSWEFGTRALILAVGVAGAFDVFLFAGELALRHHLSTGDPAVSPNVLWIIDHPMDVWLLHFVLLGAYIGGFYLWRHRTREMLGYFVPADADGAVWHWSVPVWSLLVGIPAVVRRHDPASGSDVVSALGVDALLDAVRIAGITVLLIGVVAIRDQVRQAIVDSRKPRTTAEPALVPAEFTEGVADDGWWWQVRDTVEEQDLVLLASTGEGEHRWLLIPRGGDPAKARDAIPPGATITAFPEPPAGGVADGWEPPAAEEYHGLLKEPADGALRYRRVGAGEVTVFLEAARAALSWGLYPVDAPDAVVAVVPGG
ncbi:hypothetical protein GCM10010112_90900 [Actinoplanes lobatus]|uniref:Uncharacterized protein n=1 Tax=Actinoplanes lobatus TaxID=113568 RepID=A0A7W7HKA1_9ACTN|nr:hypothetical protein [Actinoplanes lobatus]MBB4752049.1 hypothetical protein [Actinoplanes lobatus]GGN98110.1 hypothetical protein GCM10010112_90900 [Actinoplanes lobatus]GIE45874.1 hypothetical protein Alo02nite_87720 [Actinoplanes lobatus]